jgi:hypothetical protein
MKVLLRGTQFNKVYDVTVLDKCGAVAGRVVLHLFLKTLVGVEIGVDLL